MPVMAVVLFVLSLLLLLLSSTHAAVQSPTSNKNNNKIDIFSFLAETCSPTQDSVCCFETPTSGGLRCVSFPTKDPSHTTDLIPHPTLHKRSTLYDWLSRKKDQVVRRVRQNMDMLVERITDSVIFGIEKALAMGGRVIRRVKDTAMRIASQVGRKIKDTVWRFSKDLIRDAKIYAQEFVGKLKRRLKQKVGKLYREKLELLKNKICSNPNLPLDLFEPLCREWWCLFGRPDEVLTMTQPNNPLIVPPDVDSSFFMKPDPRNDPYVLNDMYRLDNAVSGDYRPFPFDSDDEWYGDDGESIRDRLMASSDLRGGVFDLHDPVEYANIHRYGGYHYHHESDDEARYVPDDTYRDHLDSFVNGTRSTHAAFSFIWFVCIILGVMGGSVVLAMIIYYFMTKRHQLFGHNRPNRVGYVDTDALSRKKMKPSLSNVTVIHPPPAVAASNSMRIDV